MTNQDQNKTQVSHKWKWLFLVFFLTVAVFAVGKNAAEFHASVIPTKSAPAYDGTTTPVLKAPKWTSLTSAEYKKAYDEIPAEKMQALPTYDPAILKTPTEQLGWKTQGDLAIRNAKITFSVPYMGNYKLDGVEYAGSHLAVDIKIPDNTPVYAIGNGIVVKTAEQSSGFGRHVVVKHENFPSLDDPNAKVTLYSSYNHLNEILVKEGDVVTKGQLIAKSGHSGLSTTPHLHFQIDNDKAPWHPYWPFTYQEATAAGLSFNDAIDAGLGKDKAILTTVNPLIYVQKYMKVSGTTSSTTSNVPAAADNSSSNTTIPVTTASPVSASATSTSGSTSNATSSTAANNNTPPANTSTTSTNTTTPANPTETKDSAVLTEESVTASRPAVAFKFTSKENSFTDGVSQTMTISAVDEDGKVAEGYSPKDSVYLQVISGAADFDASISSTLFIGGKATFEFTPHSKYNLQFSATDGSISGESDIITSTLFKDVGVSDDSYKAISFLKKYGIINGYPDGTFRPDSIVSRVEALKFILEATNETLVSNGKLPFKDTLSLAWYTDYVATAYDKSIVKGYPDLTFKPANTVNRAEFLKMLLVSMDFQIPDTVSVDVFNDVKMNSWYAPYVKFARDANIIDKNTRFFYPNEGMTRADVADLIYKSLLLKISGSDTYTTGMNVSAGKLSQYFK